MASKALLVTTLISPLWSLSDFGCNWFGGEEPVPQYPLDVCNSHSYEDELYGLWLYSTKFECYDGSVIQYEYNSTDCEGPTFNETVFTSEDGYSFECDADKSCPFTKLIFWEFAEDPSNNKSEDGHDDGHLCAFNTRKYHEVSLVTNLCIDLTDIGFEYSFMIDCNPHEITYTEYNDSECKVPRMSDDEIFRVEEGCDDVFNISAYIQVAECEDAAIWDPDENWGPDGPTGAKGSGEDGMNGSDDDNDEVMAVIFVVVIVAVVVILAILIATGIARRKSEKQLQAVNVDQEPLSVDFQSIGDAEMKPDQTQEITTQGQDVEEITLDPAPGSMVIGDMK